MNRSDIVLATMKNATEQDSGSVYTYDLSSSESPSEGVIAAVSTATGRNPVSNAASASSSPALDPLYSAIDPDALDAFFRSTGFETTTASVTFSYHEREVTVDGDGRVTVRPFDRSGDVATG